VSKHRWERFRPTYALVRLDECDIPEIPRESLITVKEVWLSADRAEAEVARLNELSSDKSAHYFMQYTHLERDS
jgi:hypothetical protein